MKKEIRPKKQTQEEMEQSAKYLASNTFEEYAGKYIAIIGEKIIATGKDPRDVYNRAIEKIKKHPLIARISKPEERHI